MENIITYETLSSFAHTNAPIVKTPVRGIVLVFNGLGFSSMFSEYDDESKRLADLGILRVIPYYNPWCWMNRQTVDYVDELVDVLTGKFDLPDDIPVGATGGSMGGQCALVYCAYARRTPAACVVNCPVCDLPYHFTERPDLPRTMYSAFGTYEGTLQEALESASPLHLAAAGKLPRIPYTVFHCEEDMAVNKQKHGDRFCAQMTENGYDITYIPVPGRGHCELPEAERRQYMDIAVDAIP